MANPHRGIVDIEIGGKQRQLRLDMNALAEAEAQLGLGGILEVIPMLEKVSLRAIRVLLWAGLRHEEKALTLEEVGSWEMTGGVVTLIGRAFRLAFPEPPEGNAERPEASPGTGEQS